MHRRVAQRSWAAAAPLGQQLAARRRPLSGSALEKSVAGVSSMLAQQDRMSVIQAHDKYGFTVNGIHMRGSVLVFPNYTLLWSPTRLVDVCPRNTAVVHMVRPKVELLLLGTGVGENVNPSMYAYFQRRGISVEPMSTMHAIAMFNTLVAEGRRVAAGLVSRTPVSRDDACLYSPDWSLARETESDKRLRAALRRDPLGGDRNQRLLEGETAAAVAASAATAEAGAAASGAARRGSSQLAQDAEALAVRFGYPGAHLDAPDRSLQLTEAERQERRWRRVGGGGGAGSSGGGEDAAGDLMRATGRPGGRAPRRSDDQRDRGGSG